MKNEVLFPDYDSGDDEGEDGGEEEPAEEEEELEELETRIKILAIRNRKEQIEKLEDYMQHQPYSVRAVRVF